MDVPNKVFLFFEMEEVVSKIVLTNSANNCHTHCFNPKLRHTISGDVQLDISLLRRKKHII